MTTSHRATCGCDEQHVALSRPRLARPAPPARPARPPRWPALVGDDLRRAATRSPARDYTGDVLVVLVLRGGFDGLSAVVPAADPAYATARPGDRRAARHADRRWTRPSGCTRRWRRSSRCGTPASSPRCTRSASPTRPARTSRDGGDGAGGARRRGCAPAGWTGCSALPARPAPLAGRRRWATSRPAVVGPAPDAARCRRIDEFALAGDDAPSAPDGRGAARACTPARRAVLAAPALAALDAPSRTARRRGPAYAPANGAAYPDGDLGDALRDVARLVKADVGLRVGDASTSATGTCTTGSAGGRRRLDGDAADRARRRRWRRSPTDLGPDLHGRRSRW